MEKVIDLEAILHKHTVGRINVNQCILSAMKEACEQTVELCAENYMDEKMGNGYISILNTKTQIK